MSVTINLSSGGKMSSMLSNNSMLKSTVEKLQRQTERDNKVAFFEAQKENLKKTEASDVEGIAKKLELYHSYEDEIKAVKQEYNSSQMFHAMDEARERGEKLAEAAKKNKPKTEEERKKEALKEVEGDESGDGMLSEIMDALDEIEEKQLEAAESTAGSSENVTSASNVEQENTVETATSNGNVIPDKYSHNSYVPFDVRV